MNRALRFTLVGLAVVVAAGCGGSSRSTSDDDGQAGPPQKATCDGIAKPVSIQTVERVLVESGLPVSHVPDSAICFQATTDPAEDILGSVSNERGGEGVKARDGSIDCSVHRGPIYPDRLNKNLHEPAYSPIFSGRKARWWFKNVECDIYTGESHPDEQVTKLDKAIERLAA